MIPEILEGAMPLGQCLSCAAQSVEQVLDMGPQPPSNLFLSLPDEDVQTHALRLGVCTCCGLVQLMDPMPSDMVRCRHDWLTYNEPESHLDAVANMLAGDMPCAEGGGPRVRGVSYKDATLLERMRQRGWVVHTGGDGGTEGLETLQARITPVWGQAERQKIGDMDVVLARHVLEHAHAPQRFLQGCLALLRPGGLLVLEVPGCEPMLRSHDHCFLWEEHICYFTRHSLKSILEHAGLELLELHEYPGALEPSLVAVARQTSKACAEPRVDGAVMAALHAARAFGASHPLRAATMQRRLAALLAGGGEAALFGAGHLGMKFINFYGLAPQLAAVVDDTPQKQGMFLPQSLLPIVPSAWLKRDTSRVCLLAINPASHQRVIAAHPEFLHRGGCWRSIYSGTLNCLDAEEQ